MSPRRRDKNRGLSYLCQMCPSCKYCREERPRRLLKEAQSYSQEEDGKSRQQTVRRVSARNSQAFKIPEA